MLLTELGTGSLKPTLSSWQKMYSRRRSHFWGHKKRELVALYQSRQCGLLWLFYWPFGPQHSGPALLCPSCYHHSTLFQGWLYSDKTCRESRPCDTQITHSTFRIAWKCVWGFKEINVSAGITACDYYSAIILLMSFFFLLHLWLPEIHPTTFYFNLLCFWSFIASMFHRVTL